MRIQNVALSIGLFLGIGSGIWACAEQAGTESAPLVASGRMAGLRPHPNPYTFVGTIHNQALDYVFHELKRSSERNRRTGGLSKDDYFRISEESLERYFTERKVGRLRAEEVRSWREVLTRHPSASASEFAGILALRDGAPLADGTVLLSPRAWDYLDEINFIADAAVDMNQLESQLWDVEARAASELLGSDLDAVYATSAVTQSSAAYWEANYDQWVSLCSVDPEVCTTFTGEHGGSVGSGGVAIQRVNGWKVLGADVVGCVGGFLRGGAWAGCAVGAGVASALSIVAQL